MLPIWFGSLIAFVYGAIVGSFLNVCIYRMPADKSIVNPPSHCPKCDTRLRGWDNIPLISFLLLGRKCRYCKAPISWRYFSVELLTGLLWVATYLRYGVSIDVFAYVLFISALLIAFFVDLDEFIIPDQVWIAGIVIGVGKDIAHWVAGDLRMVSISVPGTPMAIPLPPSIVGAVLCFSLFFLIAYVSYYAFKPKDKEALAEYEGAMGGGDVKLAAGIGAVVGLWPALVSFFIAVLLGTIIGLTHLALRARAEKRGVRWRTEIPFGPYMVAGALAVILLWPELGAVWNAWIGLVATG